MSCLPLWKIVRDLSLGYLGDCDGIPEEGASFCAWSIFGASAFRRLVEWPVNMPSGSHVRKGSRKDITERAQY